MSAINTFGIVGGGEFGNVVARHLAPPNAQILMSDKDPSVELPASVERASLGEVASADVVVLAVPFGAYEALVPQVAALANPASLLVDVCSVKLPPAQLFADSGLLDRDNVLMTHPLFGPQSTVDGVAGKKIVITQAHGDRTDALLDSWRQKDIGTITMSADDHDREMAKVHVLPFLIGRGLLEMGVTDSPLTTNYFGKLLALVEVERHHSPELFQTIQRHNPYAAEMRSEFIAQLSALHAQIIVGSIDHDAHANPVEKLERYREVLDVIDDSEITLLGLRFVITELIGQLKAQHEMPSQDPVREALQRQRLESRAIEHGVPPTLAHDIHRLIVGEVVQQHDAQKQATFDC